jgi:RP/EB family microtubule-associated protein
MAGQGKDIGMMNPAYFASRTELLQWVNSTLQLNITKVEDMSNGAAYYQLMDALYPNVVQLSKINWNARLEPEKISNFKLLQLAFKKIGIEKPIDMTSLIKGKPLDNLEFM